MHIYICMITKFQIRHWDQNYNVRCVDRKTTFLDTSEQFPMTCVWIRSIWNLETTNCKLPVGKPPAANRKSRKPKMANP